MPSFFEIVDSVTVSKLLLRYLQIEQVDNIFGIPGQTNMQVLCDLRDDAFRNINYIICRHETGAAYMADGYFRVTGKLGVVMVTSGPGATNALTGTMNAQNCGSAVLTITGEIAQIYDGLGFLQEGIDSALNVDSVYGNAVWYSAVVTSPNNFQTLFTQALRDALSLPHRGAHVSLPLDVSQASIIKAKIPNKPSNYRAIPTGCDSTLAESVFDYLDAARRPLIFLGNGCRDALLNRGMLRQLTELSEKFAFPIITTPDAKGIFPEAHAMSLRNYGTSCCEWPAHYMKPDRLEPKYDGLLVIGSQLGGFATAKWDPILMPDGPVIQVDLDQNVIGRDLPIAFGVVAEAGAFIEKLHACGESRTPSPDEVADRRRTIAHIKNTYAPYEEPEKRSSNAEPILPQALMSRITDHLPSGSHVFIDAGNCVGWSLNYLEINPPTQCHWCSSMGPMGFAVAAAIGARFGVPASACVAITGDSAFLMHGAEISTAAQYNVGAVCVVLADNDMAMVSQGMKHFYPKLDWNDYYKIGQPNVVQLAAALGAETYEVFSPRDMDRLFPEALRNADAHARPQVVVVYIDRSEKPGYYKTIGA